jgi:predicted ATPase
MLTAIIKALGQRPLGSDPIAQIVSAIGENPSLVVLDGAERLFPAADATLRALLEAGGAVHLLVTTRRLPQVVGSEIVPLEPLPLPSKDAPIDDLAAFPSVALYVARAQQARPEFQLTPPISEDVAALCRFLDGIPLAIELVAARAHVFTPAELLRHLEDAAKVERGAGQAALKKMWAAARTSYDLLSPGLQGFFAQLGVFRGGWTSDDAEAVTGDALASDHLEMLADDGLVRPGLVGDRTRFDMYGVLREYARSHLGTDRRAAVEEAHARHYADLAETAARELRGPHQADWLDRLDAERANLLAAMDWAASGGEPVVGLRTAASLWRLWYLRGPYREGLRLLERALAQSSEPTETTALALHGAGSLAYMLGDLGKSRDYLTQSIELSEALGANWLLAHSVNNLALCTYEAGDVEATEPLLRRSLAIKIENGDKPGEATTLLNLGLVSFELGDHDEAERLMSQSLALRRQIGSTPEVMESLVHLGFFMAMSGRREEGDDVLSQAIVSIRASGDRTHLGTALRLRGIVRGVTDEAEADLVEALDLARREGDKRLECECIGSLGRRLAVAGEPDLARPMLEASAVVAAETGFHVGTTLAASSLAMCAVQTSEWAVARAPLREALDRSQRATPSASEQLMVVDMIAAGLAAVDRGQALALAARVGNVRGLLGIPRSPEFVAWMQRFLEIEDGAVESAPQPSRGREELRGLLGEAWEVLDGLLLERS